MHRLTISLAAILCCLSLTHSRADEPPQTTTVETAWPQYRGPRGDGTWRGPKLPETWPVSGLKQLWRQPVGGGYAGVSVAEGRVFTMDRQTNPEVERDFCFKVAFIAPREASRARVQPQWSSQPSPALAGSL